MNRYFKLCLLIFLSSVKSKIQGVADKDVHLYESDELKCPSSGKVLTPEMINDNRCDCPDDGFDEPGTAACEKGRFYCKNVEKLGTYIPSFKVNDGVCDCCDGSDEYLDNFGIKCENACDALQSAHRRNALLERIKIKKARKYYEKSKLEAKEKQEELKEKLAEINQRLNELSENAISASENKNTENMDTFLADYRQKLDQLETLISNLTATDAPLNPTKVTEDSASSSKPNTWRALIDIKLKRVKDVISRISAVTSSKPAVTVTKYLPTIVTKTIVQYEPTSSSYDDRYQDMDYERDELATQAREIEESIKDPEVYGPDSVFLSLKGKCFDAEDGGFTYKLCWFEEAKQGANKDSQISIGKWNGDWGESCGDKTENGVKNYKHKIYNDGNWCGSKAREAHVHLECGWKDEIVSVSESSTCVYLFKFSTPLACILP